MTKFATKKTVSLFRATLRGKLQSLQVALLLVAVSLITFDGINYPPGMGAAQTNDDSQSAAENNGRILLLNEIDLQRVGVERQFTGNRTASSGIQSSPPTMPVPINAPPLNVVNATSNAKKQQTVPVLGTKPKPTNEAQNCCFRNSRDLNKDFTPEFFETVRAAEPEVEWSGNEYDEWLQLSSQLSSSNDCKSQWTLLVLSQIKFRGDYLRQFMTQASHGDDALFPFYPEQQPKRPRILFLGDSISRAVWLLVQKLYNPLGVVAMYGAPTNCWGFDQYEANLIQWMGSCPWDVIQFNVGMHFHPTHDNWHQEYELGIRRIVSVIRAHSPQAKIIFALTTPSPFDSSATIPDEATCPNYHKLHKAGVVPAMNDIVRSMSNQLGILINDRHSAILPSLSTHQQPCNIHFHGQGYRFLARHDWNFLFSHLNITVPNTKTKKATTTGTPKPRTTAPATTIATDRKQ